jgi:broad specificity phosphatase PhoE
VSASRLILWRHGRTSYNHGNRWQGQLDVPLDDTGLAQASSAAAVLQGLSPAAVVSSDLSRASATAAALGLPVTLDPGLREIYAGEWQGLLRTEIVDRWPAEFDAWRRGDDVRPGGGESRSEAAERAATALIRAAGSVPDGTVVAVGHGASLRGGMTLLLGLPASAWQTFGVLGNARWADLHRRGDHWTLTEYNAGAGRFGEAGREQGRLAEPLKEGAAGL